MPIEIAENDHVELTEPVDLGSVTLSAGTRGTVVHVYAGGKGAEVELKGGGVITVLVSKLKTLPQQKKSWPKKR